MHARPWEPPSTLAGTLRGGVDSPHAAVTDLVAQRLSGCLAAPRGTGTGVRPSGSSWGLGAHVVQRGEAEGGEQEEASRAFLGAPRPRPRDQVAGPQSEAAVPRLGLRSDAPRAGSGVGTRRHARTHTTTAPRPASSSCLRQKGFISFNEMI